MSGGGWDKKEPENKGEQTIEKIAPMEDNRGYLGTYTFPKNVFSGKTSAPGNRFFGKMIGFLGNSRLISMLFGKTMREFPGKLFFREFFGNFPEIFRTAERSNS